LSEPQGDIGPRKGLIFFRGGAMKTMLRRNIGSTNLDIRA
jgi:hypothetical protein